MYLLLILVVILSGVSDVETHRCSCMPLVPQDAYCHSPFVARVLVYEPQYVIEEESGDLYAISDFHADLIINQQVYIEGNLAKRYQIYPQQVFKGQEFLEDNPDMDYQHFYIHHESIYCGFVIENNKEYIVSAYLMGGRLWTDSCQLTAPWDDLPVYHQIHIAMASYDTACHCKVVDCAVSCVVEPNTCQLDRSSVADLCYMTFSHCVPSIQDTCEWNRSPKLDRCLSAY